MLRDSGRCLSLALYSNSCSSGISSTSISTSCYNSNRVDRCKLVCTIVIVLAMTITIFIDVYCKLGIIIVLTHIDIHTDINTNTETNST